MRFVAMVLVALVGWTAKPGATLIVAYRSSDAIIVAADSLRTIHTDPPIRVHVCKIRNFGDAVFAASGDSFSKGALSLDAITEELHQSKDPVLWNRIRMFDRRTEVDFNTVHGERSETDDPLSFTYILSFMLEGRLVAYKRTFTSSGGDVEMGMREILPEGEVLFSGQPDVLDDLSNVSIPDGVDDADPATLFTAIINHQAQRMPTKVGGPVDIIRLTADGPEWLQRKDQCPAQHPRPAPPGA